MPLVPADKVVHVAPNVVRLLSLFIILLFFFSTWTRQFPTLSRLPSEYRTENTPTTKWTINPEEKVEGGHRRQIATAFVAWQDRRTSRRSSLSPTSPPSHFCCTAKVRALSMGNTIEGGLMEIKTPYRIPYASQMAALDGVGYKHQPSLELFSCFLPGGPPQPIGEKRCFFATVTVC